MVRLVWHIAAAIIVIALIGTVFLGWLGPLLLQSVLLDGAGVSSCVR